MSGPDSAASSSAARPRRWKQILVTFIVVYPCVMVFTRLLAPQLGFVPEPFRSIAVVLCMCTTLTYALPPVARWAAPWTSR
jgi:antibiotic biosynthesis monooxygenase (ABM) superfamily enzyme